MMSMSTLIQSIRVVVFALTIVAFMTSLLSAGVAPTNEKKAIFPEDKGDQYMGFSLAVSGDTVVAGAISSGSGYQGAAFAFTRQSNGAWKYGAKLRPVAGINNESAGWSVAIDGDVIVMGLPEPPEGGLDDSGVAWVFIKPAGGWAGNPLPACKLEVNGRAAGDAFGYSVAIQGDIIVVGAKGATRTDSEMGMAYVFKKPAAGWSGTLKESASLRASDAAEGDIFGTCVAIDGDVIVVSAAGDDLRYPDQGSAYVFLKPASGNWAGSIPESAQLGVRGGAERDGLFSVAIEGDTIVAGAIAVDQGDIPDVGAVYVFERPAGGWAGNLAQTSVLTPSDPVKDALFGFRVAIHNNVISCGHWFGDSNRCYLYQRPADGWPAAATLKPFTATDSITGDGFGGTVVLQGDELFVSAPWVSTDFNSKVGAFYSYKLLPDADNDFVPDDQDQCPDAPDVDTDGDGLLDCEDNCPGDPNPDQADADGDGTGDVCTIPVGDANSCCGGGTTAMLTPLMFLLWSKKRRLRYDDAGRKTAPLK